MNRRILRTGSVIAALVILQAPVMFAVNGGSSPKNKPHHDDQIEEIQRSGNPTDRVRVIVRADGSNRAAVLKALRDHGISIRRQHGGTGQFDVEMSGGDLSWLDGVQGVGTVSVDYEVRPAPMSAESLLAPPAPPA